VGGLSSGRSRPWRVGHLLVCQTFREKARRYSDLRGTTIQVFRLPSRTGLSRRWAIVPSCSWGWRSGAYNTGGALPFLGMGATVLCQGGEVTARSPGKSSGFGARRRMSTKRKRLQREARPGEGGGGGEDRGRRYIRHLLRRRRSLVRRQPSPPAAEGVSAAQTPGGAGVKLGGGRSRGELMPLPCSAVRKSGSTAEQRWIAGGKQFQISIHWSVRQVGRCRAFVSGRLQQTPREGGSVVASSSTTRG